MTFNLLITSSTFLSSFLFYLCLFLPRLYLHLFIFLFLFLFHLFSNLDPSDDKSLTAVTITISPFPRILFRFQPATAYRVFTELSSLIRQTSYRLDNRRVVFSPSRLICSLPRLRNPHPTRFVRVASSAVSMNTLLRSRPSKICRMCRLVGHFAVANAALSDFMVERFSNVKSI